MHENQIAQQIVDAALRVHTALGPGLLESVYQVALAYELEKRGLRVTRQQAIPVVYEAIRIDTGFHADLVVEDKVIVEIKSVDTVAPVHKKQLLSYLKLADKRLGFKYKSLAKTPRSQSRAKENPALSRSSGTMDILKSLWRMG